MKKSARIRAAAVAAFAVAVVGIAAPAVGQDTTPPTLESATVNAAGTEITLTFNEDIVPVVAELYDPFGITVAGVAVEVTTIVFETSFGRQLVLRGPSAGTPIAQGQTVVVTYTDPTSNDDAILPDTAGNDAASFTTGEDGVPAVVNNSTVVADTTSPTLVSAEVNATGRFVSLTFSEDVTSVPRWRHPRYDRQISGVPVDGVAVPTPITLVLTRWRRPDVCRSLASRRPTPSSSPTFPWAETVVVTYTDPTAGNDEYALQDAAGNEVATFTTGVGGVPAVVNNSRVGASSDTTSPTLSSASVNAAGSEITLTFNENIYGILRAGVGQFSVTAGGTRCR